MIYDIYKIASYAIQPHIQIVEKYLGGANVVEEPKFSRRPKKVGLSKTTVW